MIVDLYIEFLDSVMAAHKRFVADVVLLASDSLRDPHAVMS